MHRSPPDPAAPTLPSFYVPPRRDRELEVLAAIVEMKGIKGAAALLGISPHTVNALLQHAYDSTGRTLHGFIYLGARDGWLAVPRLENVVLDPSIDAVELLRMHDRARRSIVARLAATSRAVAETR